MASTFGHRGTPDRRSPYGGDMESISASTPSDNASGAPSGLLTLNGSSTAAASGSGPCLRHFAEMPLGGPAARRGSCSGLATNGTTRAAAQSLAAGSELAGHSPRGQAGDMGKHFLSAGPRLGLAAHAASAASTSSGSAHASLRGAPGTASAAGASGYSGAPAAPRRTELASARAGPAASAGPADFLFNGSVYSPPGPRSSASSSIPSSSTILSGNSQHQTTQNSVAQRTQAAVPVRNSSGASYVAERPPRVPTRGGCASSSCAVSGAPPRPRVTPSEVHLSRSDVAAGNSSRASGSGAGNHGGRIRRCIGQEHEDRGGHTDNDLEHSRLQQEELDRGFAEDLAREQETAMERARMHSRMQHRARLAMQLAEARAGGEAAAGDLNQLRPSHRRRQDRSHGHGANQTIRVAAGPEGMLHRPHAAAFERFEAFAALHGGVEDETMQAIVAAMLWAQDEADFQDALRASAAEEYSGGFTVPPADESVVEEMTSVITYEGKGDQPSESCSVCLEDFKRGDALRKLQCGHRFHVMCVDQWLSQSGQCPVCKHQVRK